MLTNTRKKSRSQKMTSKTLCVRVVCAFVCIVYLCVCVLYARLSTYMCSVHVHVRMSMCVLHM